MSRMAELFQKEQDEHQQWLESTITREDMEQSQWPDGPVYRSLRLKNELIKIQEETARMQEELYQYGLERGQEEIDGFLIDERIEF